LVVAVLAVSYLAVNANDKEAAQVANAQRPTPVPTATPTPSATATPVPTPTPTPTPRPTAYTLAFSGEVLSHGPVINQAALFGDADLDHDYGPMFAEVAPLFEAADFSVCHVETPISDDNINLTGYPVFNAPRDMAVGLKGAGYDACSTASNHSFDKGAAGVEATLNQLDAAGLAHSGMARTAEERDTPRLYQLGELTIGHLSYTYGLNGFVLPQDQPFLVNVTEVDAVLADAAAAKAAGADLVVLSIQWGNEYQVDPSAVQIEQAEAFTASPDIDLIVGAHVHVVQPVDVVNGKYVIYGLGNFLSNQSADCCPAASQNGIIAAVDVELVGDSWEVVGLSVVPTRVDRSDYTIVPLPQALEAGSGDEIGDDVASLYQSVIDDTMEVVQQRGVEVPMWRPLLEQADR